MVFVTFVNGLLFFDGSGFLCMVYGVTACVYNIHALIRQWSFWFYSFVMINCIVSLANSFIYQSEFLNCYEEGFCFCWGSDFERLKAFHQHEVDIRIV